MAGPDLRFDSRDLPAAAGDSCGTLPPFRRDCFEGPPIAIERGLLVAQRLPALHCYVNVLRVQFNAQADAFGQFGGRECGARSQERLVDQFARVWCDSGSAAA